MMNHLSLTRMSTRNQVIFLLSCKGGLRSKEISIVEWNMIIDPPEGSMGNSINLLDKVSKGNSGRVIPLNKELKDKLTTLFQIEKMNKDFDIYISKVVKLKDLLRHHLSQ